uniref:Ubiquitin-like protease family profile domain-containing protein n=1 Tax=Cacopsylla melanoneura TaxID=428564 RepID=A0A8D9A9I4_9HEMI
MNKIPHFRGVFCLDEIPKKPGKYEIGVVNLDKSQNRGTHWCAYVKKDNTVYYYDSFGNLRPPLELKTYLTHSKILYNYDTDQKYGSVNCGHLCLKFIKETSENLF